MFIYKYCNIMTPRNEIYNEKEIEIEENDNINEGNNNNNITELTS